VLIAGLLGGPVAGIAAGALSPIVSSAFSGMPSSVMLPNIIVELAGYGFVAGLLCKSNMPVIGKLLIAQLAGRVLKAAVILTSVYGLGIQTIPASLIWRSIVTGLPGILLQWVIISLMAVYIKRKAVNE
jgi:hypothetical protein